MSYDLVITGGRVIDPGRDVDSQLDVAVSGGRIAAVGPDIDSAHAERTVDARGKLVVPGLIDAHTHLFWHGTAVGMDPDLAGVRSGVTTVVDAGSCGSATYDGFHELVASTATTRVLSLLHLAQTGLATMPEIRDMADVDMEATAVTMERYRGQILGINVRAVGPAVLEMGTELIKLARKAADASKTRVMVHIGDPLFKVDPPLTQRLLPLLQPGDIVTHIFTGQIGRVLDANNRVLPELLEARDRGVVFDIAHGRFNMDFGVAGRLLDQGVMPLTISTDLTPAGRDGVVKSMTNTMSKFLALGFSLNEVVRMSTWGPAGLVGMQDELGTLAEGTIADITILEEVRGEWSYLDSFDRPLKGTKALQPVLCFKDGTQYSVDYGPFPWGWLPNAQE